MVTPNGKTGENARCHVEEDHVQGDDHAIILFHTMVVQTAHPWDLWRNLSPVICNLAGVKNDKTRGIQPIPVYYKKFLFHNGNKSL